MKEIEKTYLKVKLKENRNKKTHKINLLTQKSTHLDSSTEIV